MWNWMSGVRLAAVVAAGAGAQEDQKLGLFGDISSLRGDEAAVTGVDLLAMDTSNLGDDAIAIVNTSSPSFTALTGNIAELGVCPEIEYGQDGFIYALDTGDNTLLHRLSGLTGAYIETFTIMFPDGFDVATSADWLNGALVLGLSNEGGGNGGAGVGRTEFDEEANTVDFVFSVDLGISSPLGGLTADVGVQMVYAVTAGGNTPQLLAIDNFGGVTVIGDVMENGAAAPGMTALEFGPDGQLYALPNVNTDRAGELYLVSRVSAQAVSLGSTGNTGLVSLTTRNSCSDADLAPPFGVLDFDDVLAFLVSFGAGCP